MEFKVALYNLDLPSSDDPVCKLSEGEHVLGRGQLLHCYDRLISRQHALIKICDGAVNIKSTHQNPCFYQAANSKTITLLSTTSESPVCDGDKFGLLPNQYWFRVKFVSESVVADLNDKLINAEDESSNTSLDLMNPDCGDLVMTDNVATQSTTQDYLLEHQEAESVIDDKVESLPCANDVAVASTSSASIATSPEITNDSSKRNHSCMDNVDNDNDETTNESYDNPNKILKAENVDEQDTTIKSELPDVKKEEPDSTDENQNGGAAASNSADTAVSSTSARVYRDRCKYGASCYRKNVLHKQQFSHPNDSDYDTDPNDTRPLCQYGASCYRKNSLHRQHYRHSRNTTNPTGTPKRARKKRTDTNNDTPEDDYDLEDPFIDDGSEDEYVEESWSESSDSEFQSSNNMDSEETKTLLKEAKRFRKK